jgi:hypothetical protein
MLVFLNKTTLLNNKHTMKSLNADTFTQKHYPTTITPKPLQEEERMRDGEKNERREKESMRE